MNVTNIINKSHIRAALKTRVIKSKIIKTNSKINVSSFLSTLIENSIHKESFSISRISNQIIKSSITKIIYLNVPPMPQFSVTYFFTSADLVNGKLTKYHGFNSVVDVSVFNQFLEEIEVGVDSSNSNSVTVDLSRLNVIGNWQIKIEK